MLQSLLRPVARIALGWYYRSIVVANEQRIPREGPIFVAVNHPNALVDALVIGSVLPRRVLFTAKATIFANPVVARFLSRAGVVPLRRSSDETARAMHGERTQATPAMSTSGQPDPAVSTSGQLEPARNASTFGAVADALAQGLAVVIFPEGKSHDEPQLAPLRTGLARMALMARDERGVRGIRIVPVGILFERKEEPRSRVLLQVGDPIDIDNAPHGAGAVAALTETVAQRLAAVTLNFENAADAERINRAADVLTALLAPVGTVDDTPTLQDTLAVIRRADRVNRAIRKRGDVALASRATAAEARLDAFRNRLATLGVHTEDIAIDAGSGAGARLVVRESLRALVLFPLSLWGRITHFLPVRITRWLALRSVRSRDEPAMRTLVIGLVLVLATYVVETALVAWVAGGWWAAAFALTLVPSASSDFRYSDRARRLRTRARAWSLFRRTPGLQQELVAEADWLRRESGAIEQAAFGA